MKDRLSRASTREPVRRPEARQELLHALFGHPDTADFEPALDPAELERLFAAAPATEPGAAPDGDGIDPETLAALLEGALTKDERSRVVAILASDDKAFDQFLTVSRFHLGRRSLNSAAATPIERAPRHRPNAVRWLLPIAAALALLLVWPLAVQRSNRLPSGDRLVAEADGPEAGFTPFELERPVLRSPPPEEEPALEAVLVELGIRIVDLAWLARQPDRGEALSTWSGRVIHLAQHAGASPAPTYRMLVAAPASPAPDVLQQLALAEAALASEIPREPPLYDLGLWSEAVRLAAISRSESFFRDRALYQRPLERFRRARPDPSVAMLLAELPDAGARVGGYEEIRRTLEAIQAHCLGGGDCLGGHPGDG